MQTRLSMQRTVEGSGFGTSMATLPRPGCVHPHRREGGHQSGPHQQRAEPGARPEGAHDRGEAGAANSAAFIFRTSSAYEEVWMILSNWVR